MVCGGMVAIMCTSVFVVSGICWDVPSLWLMMKMVVVFGSALVAILAQCMASIVVLWSVGYASPIPCHLEDWACPMEPKIVSLL